MKAKEIILVAFGFFLISYLILSILAFLDSPIDNVIIYGLIFIFMLYSIWFVRSEDRKEKIAQ